jgi:hypothetical protein
MASIVRIKMHESPRSQGGEELSMLPSVRVTEMFSSLVSLATTNAVCPLV